MKSADNNKKRFQIFLILSWASLKTSEGINFCTNNTMNGKIKISSIHPANGIKLGIKSIGLTR
jgi:hypothetical protein